ncbi:uncharacterized protein Z520_03070 [Fonsecaea multimorphosa CBS 102226]|uniref:ferric-chelate reductase (NADPH) n=1 Tax=Fonsecaea multimorphosa CBS 102226 TaxID=1442371 RepID=A0A0D2K6N4_9EURO|nr:uncharacterized protein Z520_03070 [Fonsecaea multimorphosa CBS 102226]KIY01518.1 hypothetical protein Z520_03070 [Fonsecaea multimorphosa CBS 102226]OAL28277.1 hypothetical protein AYO22_02983 [Fonsecaea multimorphosa]
MATIFVAAQASTTGNSTTGGNSYYQEDAAQVHLEGLNRTIAHSYLGALLGVVALLFAYSVTLRLNAHIRHLASMSGAGALRYFSSSSPALSLVKSKMLYAPILFYRRAREIRFSRRVTLGTVPTRLQSIFILSVVITNVFLCTWDIPWSKSEQKLLPILRNRTGTLAVTNFIPIMVMATVKNPLISMLDISYDTFNLMHRWFGRLAICEVITHVLCWLIAKVQSSGWAAVKTSLESPFIYSGLTAAISLVLILLSSPKMIRNLAYEFFLHLHIVLVVLVLVFLWRHLEGVPQRGLLLGAAIIWATARSLRLATLIYRSVGTGGTKVKIDPLNGGVVKITLTSPRPWTYRPGQSLYLTIPSIGLWTAHPFSVAWSGIEDPLSRSSSLRSNYSEKRPIIHISPKDIEKRGEETMSLIVKKETGMTNKLWHRAMTAGAGLELNALIEGPYGTERSMSSYGTVVLFASGVGITHQLGYVKELVEGYSHGTVAAKRVTLVWVIPNTECLDWIRPWMHEILSIEGRREVLKVLLYVTRVSLSQAIRSPSEHVQMARGRPDVEAIIAGEAKQKVGCMGVSVCAGGGLADEVRRASRAMLDIGVNVDFVEEGFGW